jgi:spectinomycin phosphotransferase
LLEKPDLPDELILNTLRDAYHLAASELAFLPLGNETGVWVYRARAVGGQDVFLKLRRGEPLTAALAVPRFLHENGVPEAVAPLPSRSGALATPLGSDYHLVVYPFIAGENAMDSGLRAAQWVELGRILRRIHSARLPAALRAGVRQETYRVDAPWIEVIAAVSARVNEGNFAAEFERETARFWLGQRQAIAQVQRSALRLGRALRANRPPQVLCHADIHTANLLVDGEGSLHILDWDQPVIAPKERDLMFIVDANAADEVRNEAETFFYQGYGQVEIDWTALAYYRYNWAVQEIADYARRVFIMPALGDLTRREAARELPLLFAPGREVERARMVRT